MQGLLSLVAGRHVTVELANSEQLFGKVIQVKSDYMTILDQNGILIYIQFCHIISTVINHAELVLPMDGIETVSLPTFVELLRSLSGQIIRVGIGNRMNDGVVYQVNDKEISLILDMKHTIYYPICQIQRFSIVLSSDKSDTLNNKNEDTTESNATEKSSVHNGKSEGNTADTLAVQKVLDTGDSTNFRKDVTVTESNKQTHRDEKKSSTASPNLTVFQAKQTDDLDKDLMERSIRWYKPTPEVYGQRETTQKPQIPNRCPVHAGASKLTLFHSTNKHFGHGVNTFLHKFS